MIDKVCVHLLLRKVEIYPRIVMIKPRINDQMQKYTLVVDEFWKEIGIILRQIFGSWHQPSSRSRSFAKLWRRSLYGSVRIHNSKVHRKNIFALKSTNAAFYVFDFWNICVRSILSDLQLVPHVGEWLTPWARELRSIFLLPKCPF